MKKKEYKDKMNVWDSIRKAAEEQMNALKEKWQGQCKHKEEHITMMINYAEDEFGKAQPDWYTYNYECTNCGKSLKYVQKRFETYTELKEALNK